MLHLQDVVEVGANFREERVETQRAAKAPLVALNRIPLDADHPVFRLLDALRELVAQAVGVGVQHNRRAAVGGGESLGLLGGDAVADVFDDHDFLLT